jgi:hypothetical protein
MNSQEVANALFKALERAEADGNIAEVNRLFRSEEAKSLIRATKNLTDWQEAIKKAEVDGDTAKVIALLRSKTVELPQRIRDALAELLERRQLVRRKGAQRVPIFEMRAEHKFKIAAENVGKRMKEGIADLGRLDPNILQELKAKMDELLIGIDENKGPIYDRKLYGIMVQHALENKRNISVEEAIEDEVAYWPGMTAKKLQNYLKGKTGFSRTRK